MVGIPRQTQYQMPHYIRFTVNYNDTGISSGVVKGTLPADAQIIGILANIQTVFNAGTTNVLTLGTSSTATQYVAAGDLDEATAATTQIAPSAAWGGISRPSVDTDVYVKYAQTGTAATTGKATFVISFAPNNDG
jgi:hypothetical protein